MRLVRIETRSGEDTVINVKNITSINNWRNEGKISITLAGTESVQTKFTSVDAAVDFIQRAPSVSMGVA